jgi:hypothetical protein
MAGGEFMLRELLILSMLLVALASLPGCIIHDPGYRSDYMGYYSEPYYPYYGPYLYSPFWFSGYSFYGDFGRGHDYHGRGFGSHGDGRGHR